MTGFANNLIGRESPLDRVRRRHKPAAGTLEVESDISRRKPCPGGQPCTPVIEGLATSSKASERPASRSASAPVASRRPRSPRSSLTTHETELLRSILAEPMDYMHHPDFEKAGAEKRIYEKAAPVRRPDVRWYRPLMDELGTKRDATVRRHDSVVLTAAEERVLFMQYNYARFRVRSMQDALAGRAPSNERAREMLRWHMLAQRYREQIAETNLALVLAMAKRVRLHESEFGDLISEGNMALMRSVDKFDCGRGFKFSTYACRAILKAFSRHGIKVAKHRARFPSEFDPALERSNHVEEMRTQSARESAAEVRHIVEANTADLNEIERAVIVHRFGLDAPPDRRQLTLEQVGEVIGVTKERVRQIQNRALEKIKLAIEGVPPPAAVTVAALDARPEAVRVN